MNRRFPFFAIPALFLTVLAAGAEAQTKSTAPNGGALYVAKGCYECHGYQGRGASGVGPRLAPGRLPPAVFEAYVRKPGGVMPPYSTRLVSPDEMRAIQMFLDGLPAPKSSDAIPLLAPYSSPQK